jgi:hypothetical protein
MLAVALTSCATEVSGPHAQSLSATDIQEIRALTATHPDIHKFVLRISATRRDCVYVETGTNAIDQTQTSFIACKRHGKWHIKEGSIEKWRVIVTS